MLNSSLENSQLSIANISIFNDYLRMTENIILIPSNPVELSNFMAWEQHPDAAEHVAQNSLKEHLATFFDPKSTYLTIEKEGEPAGFMLLGHDSDEKSIELRRVVVGDKESGVGQVALRLLEAYVVEQFNRSRIWLDVFVANQRAIYIYKKLGYSQFGSYEYVDGRLLLLFEKMLE